LEQFQFIEILGDRTKSQTILILRDSHALPFRGVIDDMGKKYKKSSFMYTVNTLFDAYCENTPTDWKQTEKKFIKKLDTLKITDALIIY